jgi:hypothetical protein
MTEEATLRQELADLNVDIRFAIEKLERMKLRRDALLRLFPSKPMTPGHHVAKQVAIG